MMKRTGLVLCGGGAKGAFQIGAWKALEKHGILRQVDAISGTSVGALNAVLFAIGDYGLAERIWRGIRKEDLLKLQENFDGGLFDRSGLEQIIDQRIPLGKLRHVRKKVYVTVFENGALEHHCLNSLPEDEIQRLMFASSAIPGIFHPELYKGKRYFDGGILERGNVPVQPLGGYQDICILSLDHYFNPYQMQGGRNLFEVYPETGFTIIQPMKDTGGLLKGTLNFDSSYIRTMMEEGYQAADQILSKGPVHVKNQHGDINIRLRNRMLTMFRSEAELEAFIRESEFSNFNIPFPTLGGEYYYEDVVVLFGWKLQQHKVPGLMSHYRIIDSMNIRRAWVMNPEDLLHALNDYEAAGK